MKLYICYYEVVHPIPYTSLFRFFINPLWQLILSYFLYFLRVQEMVTRKFVTAGGQGRLKKMHIGRDFC